jgi:hypothetical protein
MCYLGPVGTFAWGDFEECPLHATFRTQAGLRSALLKLFPGHRRGAFSRDELLQLVLPYMHARFAGRPRRPFDAFMEGGQLSNRMRFFKLLCQLGVLRRHNLPAVLMHGGDVNTVPPLELTAEVRAEIQRQRDAQVCHRACMAACQALRESQPPPPRCFCARVDVRAVRAVRAVLVHAALCVLVVCCAC